MKFSGISVIFFQNTEFGLPDIICFSVNQVIRETSTTSLYTDISFKSFKWHPTHNILLSTELVLLYTTYFRNMQIIDAYIHISEQTNCSKILNSEFRVPQNLWLFKNWISKYLFLYLIWIKDNKILLLFLHLFKKIHLYAGICINVNILIARKIICYCLIMHSIDLKWLTLSFFSQKLEKL